MPDDGRKFIKEHKRPKIKGRKTTGGFLLAEHRWLNSEEFGNLSGNAVKLLLELAGQYRGSNNGDLQAAWSLMAKRGWHSPGTLQRAKQELLESGFAIVTRQGGRNRCSLYALTFWAIDACAGKHDEQPTRTPLQLWRKPNSNPAG